MVMGLKTTMNIIKSSINFLFWITALTRQLKKINQKMPQQYDINHVDEKPLVLFLYPPFIYM